MSQTIRLHGGPMHGQTVAVQDNRSHFHIVAPEQDSVFDFDEEASTPLPTREGMYSRVGKSDNFEWDGWRSHD